MATRRGPIVLDDQDADSAKTEDGSGYAARLVTQGKHKFYTLTLPSDVLAKTCVVETRLRDPIEGFQRKLDEKRAQDIADYIDSGFGTIPCSIVLSAQPEAELEYLSKSQVLRFKRVSGAFLILDGQHRVYGFHKARTSLRVPVVIYNGLTRSEEARLFIDINTKQRPVPNELLLDIKRMADAETDVDAIQRDVYDLFNSENDSPLIGMMSPSSRSRGKISRVTFKVALNSIWRTVSDSDAETLYSVLRSYLAVWAAQFRKVGAPSTIANSTMFRAIILLFPLVAERVSDRYGSDFSVDNFDDVMRPFFLRLKRSHLTSTASGPVALFEEFKKALQSGFSIGARTS
jgi:DGQHR domain-containing protein